MVLHRRSKLSNVLCLLNCPSPCSPQDSGFQTKKVSFSVDGRQQRSFKGAILLHPGEVLVGTYSPTSNCRASTGWTQDKFSTLWYHCAHTNRECPEEARAEQTPVDECVWTLRSSSVLPYSQTQPLRKRVLFTKHRYLPLVCLFFLTLPKQRPPSMSNQKWNKVGERCSWTWLEVGWKPQKYTVWSPLKTTD